MKTWLEMQGSLELVNTLPSSILGFLEGQVELLPGKLLETTHFQI